MISRDLRRFLEKNIDIETYIIQSNQIKKSKNNSAKFKLEKFVSETSQISKIGHFVSVLKCMKQRQIF